MPVSDLKLIILAALLHLLVSILCLFYFYLRIMVLTFAVCYEKQFSEGHIINVCVSWGEDENNAG